MFDLAIQSVLYGVFFVTVMAVVAGGFLFVQLRRGQAVSLYGVLALLSLLAGVSPYVGLFGTVLHIIDALAGLGSGQVNVASIAVPIGQALYATLWGLASAILAMLAHRVLLMLEAGLGREAPGTVDAEANASGTDQGA